MADQFKALVVREDNGNFKSEIEYVPFSSLPTNEVLIKVGYSSINYKDALSSAGNRGVTHKFPHVPGIDATGQVVSSTVGQFNKGDNVLVTGYDLGMNTWGGFGEYICVPADWIIKLPGDLTPMEAMSFGTAGLTAGLSVFNLIQSGIDKGKIVVSGATGGVGTIAISILSKLGYDVVAVSGKNEDNYLIDILGASSYIARDTFIETHDAKAMSRAEFDGGIDTVGGNMLSSMLKSSKYNAVVTCCGNVASAEFTTSIFPFILRGIKLIGIDSVEQKADVKTAIWNLLSHDWKPMRLQDMVREISLEQVPDVLEILLKGKAKGRFVINHSL
ncbi:YhdH/YhfP family quinone oxidoreductase [Sphingobacterium mizutaii]|uniref:YhdH/YhfP family quinone oxidoreductase n=1 Tax=Sphingobacterium mizutaii TaxID=1010 RepID=UPI0016257E4D|nr:YhdH/YhfP family quinone oxidoreductase [Sphingobacterium mizutaii]